MAHSASVTPEEEFDATRLTRPAPELLTYYVLGALLTLPGVVFVLPPLWFRYLTLRYSFDREGVSLRVGLLFKREVLLTYRRIQDIHVTRNLIQRWLGIASVSIQTASGSSSPEMTIEGVANAEQLRDFLYQQMRGAKGEAVPTAAEATGPSRATQLLTEIRDNLAQLNHSLQLTASAQVSNPPQPKARLTLPDESST